MKRHPICTWTCGLACAALLAIPAAAQKPPPDVDMQELMKAMGQVMTGSTSPVEVVNFRELKALLPESLDGMKRKNATGEKTGMMGMTVAYAEGWYEDEAGGSVEVKLTDMAGTGALGRFSTAGWASMEIDSESDTGFERTTTFSGHKGYEKYQSDTKRGEIQVIVKDRFIVEIHGSGVPVERIKEALGKIDLEKLAELKPAPAAPQ